MTELLIQLVGHSWKFRTFQISLHMNLTDILLESSLEMSLAAFIAREYTLSSLNKMYQSKLSLVPTDFLICSVIISRRKSVIVLCSEQLGVVYKVWFQTRTSELRHEAWDMRHEAWGMRHEGCWGMVTQLLTQTVKHKTLEGEFFLGPFQPTELVLENSFENWFFFTFFKL